jgi:hypothetical protein
MLCKRLHDSVESSRSRTVVPRLMRASRAVHGCREGRSSAWIRTLVVLALR